MNYYRFGALMMTVLITIVFISLLVLLFAKPIDVSSSAEKMLLIIVGAVGQSWGTAVVYWLGTSAGSAAKGEQIAELLKGNTP